MDALLQQLVNGLILGYLYALGYTLVYGILEFINFAHGEVVMLGALVAVTVLVSLAGAGLPLPLALLIALAAAVLACVLTALLIEWIAYRPLRQAPRLAPLITAIGTSIMLQNLAMIIWGRQYLAFPAVLELQAYEWMGATITNEQILIVVRATLVMAGLLVLVNRTRLGRAMRATAQNQSVAGLIGVDVNRVIATSFTVGAALAAVAGLLVAAYYGIAHYDMGSILRLKAFTAAVLGGIWNVPGAVLGGLLLGVLESLGAGYIGDLTGGFLGERMPDKA